MSDDISKNSITGKDEMFYVRSEGVPWHGKGTSVEGILTAKEAIIAAGQAWEAVMDELVAVSIGTKIPGFRSVHRADTKDFLGICKKGYKIFQNQEAFDFFDAVVGTGDAKYHTAGCLGKGEKTWVLAKLPTDLLIAPDDVVEKYILLINSFDRTCPLTMFYTPIRVVCKNTLNAAVSDGKKTQSKKGQKGIKIRHSKNMNKKVEEAQRALGLAIDYYNNLDEYFHAFYTHEFRKESEAVEYFEKVVPDNDKAKHTTRTQNQRDAFLQIFEDDVKNESRTHKKSLWYAYNAVTKYADHHLSFRETETSTREDNRIQSIWFGRSRDLKQAAFVEAASLIK